MWLVFFGIFWGYFLKEKVLAEKKRQSITLRLFDR
jgi:hypothetical protein